MRRVLEVGSALVALVALALVLYNATLVDRRPPSLDRVALSLPAGDSHTGQTLTAIDLEFSEPVQPGSVESRFRVDVTDVTGVAGAPNAYVTGTFSWNGSKTSAIFTPSSRLPGGTQFKVIVQAGFQDVAGNAASSAPDAFVFKTVGPPTVLAIDPADGAPSVAVDQKLKITFDRLMDTGAVEAALRITPGVEHQTTWAGAVLTLTFGSSLQFGTHYTVTIGQAAVDEDGSHLAAPFSSSFATVAAGLSAIATVPAANVSGASLRGPIAIVFDGPVDPASVADSLRITPSVPGSASVASLVDDNTARPATQASPSPTPGQVLLFTPSAQLAPHTTYTVSLAPTVRKLGDPGQVAAARTWTFTTGQITTSAQNQVAFLSDRGGVRNLWLMNPDGSNPRQITTELVPVTGSDVTSDGGTIAYSAGGVVHVIRTDGSDARAVGGSDHWDYSPTFSPDGRSLIVARRGVDGTDLGFWLVPLPGAADDRERQIMATGAPPIGSASSAGDGLSTTPATPAWFRRAAFGGDTGSVMLIAADGHAWIVDLGAPAASPADVGLIADSAPVWIPGEASFIVAGTQSSGSASVPGIWRVQPTGAVTRVGGGNGAIAADGKGALAILLGGQPGAALADPLHLAYLALGASSPTALTDAPDLADRSPTFSPNGDLILFLRVSTATLDRSDGIWVIQPNGRELRQLSTDGSYPRWLP